MTFVGRRTGVVATPNSMFPSHDWMVTHRLGWLRSIVYELDGFQALYDAVPEGTYIFALLNGQSEGINNDFWTEGWEQRWANLVESFCLRYHTKVKAIEFLNEWSSWGDADRANVAARCAIIGTAICRRYGILGFVGSVADEHWTQSLKDVYDLIKLEELSTGKKLVHGFILHPYGKRSGKVPLGWATSISEALIEARNIVEGRLVCATEAGLKLADVNGSEASQHEYVHSLYRSDVEPDTQEHRGELYKLAASDCLCIAYFCWGDDTGSPGEHGENAFGLIDDDGNARMALQTFETVCLEAPVESLPSIEDIEDQEPEVPTFMSATEALERMWKMHQPNAVFRPTWGVEKAWMANYHQWGSVVFFDEEVQIEYKGTLYNGRFFANAIVIWINGEARVLHDTGLE